MRHHVLVDGLLSVNLRYTSIVLLYRILRVNHLKLRCLLLTRKHQLLLVMMLLVHLIYVVALHLTLLLILRLRLLLLPIEVNLRTVLHLLSRLYLVSQEGTVGLAVSASRGLWRSTSLDIWRRINLVNVSIIIIVVAILVHDVKTRQELSLLLIFSEVALHHLHLQLLLFFVKL